MIFSSKNHPGLKKDFTVRGGRVSRAAGARAGAAGLGGCGTGTRRDGAPAPGGRTALLTASPAPLPTIPSCFCVGDDLTVPAPEGLQPAREGGQPCPCVGAVPARLQLCAPAAAPDPELPGREVPAESGVSRGTRLLQPLHRLASA